MALRCGPPFNAYGWPSQTPITQQKENMETEFTGIAILTGHTCGHACWHAKEEVCRCSCGGKNHGIFERGGERPARTSKISGRLYELVEVGTGRQIEKRRFEELDAMNYHWYYDPKGPWIAKPATTSQLKNWPELTAFQDSDSCYLLWHLVAVTV